MKIKGRDVEEKCLNVAFDKDICSWRITGEGELIKGDPQAQTEVISILEGAETEGMKLGDISNALNKSNSAILNILKALEAKDRVFKVSHGKYILSQFKGSSQVHESSQMNISEYVNKGSSQVHISLGKSEYVNFGKPSNSTDSTQNPLLAEIPPGYGAQYDYAYTEFLSKGLTHEEATREALEAVKGFAAQKVAVQ